ncbi:MAG TPA: type II toxin-antitoxin system death-on-curing family toxin [Pseudonocardiaceae bacterium]|nr:type II toxin-antitoxin system death-on-curing family toxin [Pseudonocardiaceae bacterium]
MTEFLDLQDLLDIARDATGGEVAVRDVGLLASAAARPQTSAFGADAYPTVHGKASALLHSLACNHALVDGNKRLAWLATYVFLDLNGQRPSATDDEVVELILEVAEGRLVEVEKIASRLAEFTRR